MTRVPPKINLNPEAMPWARWLQDGISDVDRGLADVRADSSSSGSMFASSSDSLAASLSELSLRAITVIRPPDISGFVNTGGWNASGVNASFALSPSVSPDAFFTIGVDLPIVSIFGGSARVPAALICRVNGVMASMTDIGHLYYGNQQSTADIAPPPGFTYHRVSATFFSKLVPGSSNTVRIELGNNRPAGLQADGHNISLSMTLEAAR